MNSFLKSCTALTVALTFSGQAVAQVKELGKGEGQVNIVACRATSSAAKPTRAMTG